MLKIDVTGTMLAYDDTDATEGASETGGRPVVLLHAGIADRRMWRHQVAALAHRHRVLAPDLSGYGESALPAGPFAHHDDVVGLIDA
ncbi:MAG TPA: alpha/beta fold hydrolase, partial [Micromonosporaceae bacterium]